MANKNLLYTIIASQMKGIGVALEGLDTDTKGKDDIAGLLLDVGSDVVLGYVSGSDAKLIKAVKAIHDATGEFLKAQGAA